MPDSQPTRRRLFVALALPEAVRNHLADAVEHVRVAEPGGAEPAESASAVRWTEPTSWHLTLVFCGAVSPDHEAVLTAGLARASAGLRPLRLGIAGGGRFGHRVLWAGVGGDRTALAALAASAGAAATVAGIPVEDRPHRPHLTIARGRPGANLAPAAAALDGYVGPTWVADEIRLIESVLGAGPDNSALHVVVAGFSLG